MATAKSFHACVFIGTQVRALPGMAVQKRKLYNTLLIEAGWSPGAYTNKSAGISITISSGLREHHIVRQWQAPAEIAGRAFELRLKRTGLDFTVAGVYFPPRPRGRAGRPNYFAATNRLVSWLRGLSVDISRSSRTMPLISMDLNDGIGIVCSDGRWQSCDTTVIPSHLATREHLVGGAG
eukprot:7297959-Pyramimonas_sp.AAC.1